MIKNGWAKVASTYERQHHHKHSGGKLKLNFVF